MLRGWYVYRRNREGGRILLVAIMYQADLQGFDYQIGGSAETALAKAPYLPASATGPASRVKCYRHHSCTASDTREGVSRSDSSDAQDAATGPISHPSIRKSRRRMVKRPVTWQCSEGCGVQHGGMKPAPPLPPVGGQWVPKVSRATDYAVYQHPETGPS